MQTIVRHTRRVLSLLAVPSCMFGLVVAGSAGADPHRLLGDVQTLAAVPSPGFPEGIAVDNKTVYVAGPARFGTAGDGQPSTVFAYDIPSGALLTTYEIQGENLAFDHANSCIALDHDHRLYVINLQLGVVRLDVATGAQEIYSPPVPDLPTCGAAPGGPCSPTFIDLPPLANDIAFDEDGFAYITDSFQATIWRIPPGGGPAEIWFQDGSLATPFGPNGLRVDPTGTKVYFAVTAEGVDGTGAFTGGKIYWLPRIDAPTAADLHVFHQYHGEAPDGIAFGKRGDLYVALAAPFRSGISVLSPDGVETARYSNPFDPFAPFDSPANIAFDRKGSLLVTNHAFLTGVPSHFTVLDVWVDDKGTRLEEPEL